LPAREKRPGGVRVSMGANDQLGSSVGGKRVVDEKRTKLVSNSAQWDRKL